MAIKVIVALVFGFAMTMAVFFRFNSKAESESDNQRYLSYAPAMYNLPLLFVMLFVVCLIFLLAPAVTGAKVTRMLGLTLSMLVQVSLTISVYYLVLVLLMPMLRRLISSRTCAMLWILPDLLYFIFYLSNNSGNQLPGLVLCVSKEFIWITSAIWAVGFFGVLIWKTVEHFVFRSGILKGSGTVTDQRVLDIWNKELDDAYEKNPEYALVVSPHVSSPLSVGFFRRTIRVVLPEREYTDDELSMIFRHEIVHLCREDSANKFFLVFCSALCWFNPLVWIAMKKSAEDIELSCDETVLLKADEARRYEYAGLLLSNAGSMKGFTTCLSASAASMRYRLRAITKPKKMRTGAVIAGLSTFALIMSCGLVALACGDTTGADILYGKGVQEQYHVSLVRQVGDEFDTELYLTDEKAFHEYMSDMKMITIFGRYSFLGLERQYAMLLDTPEGPVNITLSDNYINISPLNDQSKTTYYLPDGVDWGIFESLVTDAPPVDGAVRESDA